MADPAIPAPRTWKSKLRAGGIFGLWSNETPDPRFTDRLSTVFAEAWAKLVTFRNPASLGRAPPDRVPALPVQGHAQSGDILIISPNRVFADYIGNVLPGLGVAQAREIGMETLADELLARKYRFQSFFEQTAALGRAGSVNPLDDRAAGLRTLP